MYYFIFEKRDNRLVGAAEDYLLKTIPDAIAKQDYNIEAKEYLKDCNSEEEKLNKMFKDAKTYYDYDFLNENTVEVTINHGDWKHDHIFCDRMMRAAGYTLITEHTTEESQDDTYSSIHMYRKVTD